MATGPGFPSGTNTYVPSFDSSGRLTIGFSRNPKRFALPRYVQYVTTPKDIGYYLNLTAEEAARVAAVEDFIWPDGADAPNGADGTESFNYQKFSTQRYAYPFVLGRKAVQQADWGIVEQHSQIHAAKLMTARTIRLLTVATTTGNWATSHTATATALSGGQWDLGTSTAPYIKKSLDKMLIQIVQDTLGVVQQQDLILVINPNMARLMAEAPEIHDYMKGSYAVKEELTEGLGPNNRFGLPSQIYGYNIVVDDTVKVTTRKGITTSRSFAMPDQTALLVSRVGGIEGTFGAPSFSTLTMFMFEEMTLESFDDQKNRRVEARVVEDAAEVLTAGASGFLLTTCTSVAS
jgi:hypothetical protein